MKLCDCCKVFSLSFKRNAITVSLGLFGLSRPKLFQARRSAISTESEWEGARACVQSACFSGHVALWSISSTSTTITQNDMAKLRGIKKAMTTGLWLYRRRHTRRSCDEFGCAEARRSEQHTEHRGVREVFAQIIDPTLHHCWLESRLPCQIGRRTNRAITKFIEFLLQKLMSLETLSIMQLLYIL